MPRKTKQQLHQEAIDKLVQELFRAVGLYMSNNYIFDQDTNLPWKFKNKFMKYGNTVIHVEEDIFQPLLSKPMVRDLFNIALVKNDEYGDIYIRSVCPIFEGQQKGMIINTDTTSIYTRMYKHEVLVYYDACFILANTLNDELIDLLNFVDSFMSDLIPKRTVRRKKGTFDGLYRTTGKHY